MEFPINWPKLLSEMEADRNGWRASHDRVLQDNKRLRTLIANVISKYDDCEWWKSEMRAAYLINVTLREAMKEVG